MVFVYSYGPFLRLVPVTDLRLVSSQLGSATDLCFVLFGLASPTDLLSRVCRGFHVIWSTVLLVQ